VTFTADQLEALAGVTFTSAETTRADAILTLCVTAAEGIHTASPVCSSVSARSVRTGSPRRYAA
jgi:hypothetical protein